VLQYQALSDEEQARLVGSHYMGAVVLKQSEENSDEWDVIDGQQRLTTVTLLLAAVRDHMLPIVSRGRRTSREPDPETVDLRRNFNSQFFITPPTRPGAQAKPRIIPQKRDEVPFNAVINWSDPTLKLDARSLGLTEPSNVLPAYAYFKKMLNFTRERAERDDSLRPFADLFPLDIELIQAIAATRLLFIEVRTTGVDDANAIFESLNYKVVPLGAVDLLKNYLFMLLRSDQTRLLDEWWEPSVRRLGGEAQLGDFVLHDLVSRGLGTSKNALYEAKQAELRTIYASGGKEALWQELIRMRASLTVYLTVSAPETHCSQPAIRQALLAIHAAQGSTAVPLLMYLLRSAEAEGVDETTTVEALRLVESYLVRRFLVGEDSHNLNSYFSSMLSKAFGRDRDVYAALPFLDRVAAILDSSGKDWPGDDRVKEGVRSGVFYGRGEPSQRMLVFRRLDSDFGQALQISWDESQIETEHIFPQNEDGEGFWRSQASLSGYTVDEFQSRYLHALANLTPLLKSENASASNRSFAEKVLIYQDSSLKITSAVSSEFGPSGVWGEAEVTLRAEALGQRVCRIWPKPIVAAVGSSPVDVTDEDALAEEAEADEILAQLVDDTMDGDGSSTAT
jgi:hypothetical protein